MSEVDTEAVVDSVKGLSICFILAILAVNGILILKTVRKGGFWHNPKSLTLISLAIGDIFLALFSLVVMAKIVFEPESSVSCSTVISSGIYWQFLLPFVYGVGLIMLAVELVIRQRAVPSPNNTTMSILKAIVFSATPWLLGLIIVLPLTMAGMDWVSCLISGGMTVSRIRAIYWISVFVPASAALITCIVIMCIRRPFQSPQGFVTAPPAVSYAPPLHPDSNNVSDSSKATQQPPTVVTPGYNQYQNPQQGPGGNQYQYPMQAPGYNPQYAANPYYPGQQYPAQPYYHQPGSYATAHVHVAQPPVTSTPTSTDTNKERNLLLLAAVLYFCCVIPNSGFMLGYVHDFTRHHNWDPLTLTIVRYFFQWLMISRSVITPFLWVGCSRD